MASLEERFQKGLEIRARLAGGEGRLFKGSVPVAYELAPDMYRITTECLYGAIWSRPGLDIRYRAMATVTVSAIQLATPQVRTHIRNALNVGITPEEIIEICMMITFYGGVPAAYNALAVTKEVFEERGLDVTLPETFDDSVVPDTLYERGIAKHQELMPDVFGYHPMEPTDVEHDLDILMQEYLWGAIWTRPGLDMKSRIVCALASRVVKGQYDLSGRRMIEGALRCGLTKTEIMEIGIQLAFYVGILPARAFMHIANTVFRAPEFAHL
jgi:4-carboxymuconolactone decarboxylase